MVRSLVRRGPRTRVGAEAKELLERDNRPFGKGTDAVPETKCPEPPAFEALHDRLDPVGERTVRSQLHSVIGVMDLARPARLQPPGGGFHLSGVMDAAGGEDGEGV